MERHPVGLQYIAIGVSGVLNEGWSSAAVSPALSGFDKTGLSELFILGGTNQNSLKELHHQIKIPGGFITWPPETLRPRMRT